MKKKLVFLGPPGAGKGTFAEILIKEKGLTHISTGDIFREEIRAGSALGKEAKRYVDSGELVPDEVVSKMVGHRLARPDCADGFILDGFPRTLNQAALFEKTLAELGLSVDAVIYFKADRELLMKRLTARLTCKECGAVFNLIFTPPKVAGVCDHCGKKALYQREDDSAATAAKRLDLYEAQTAPLVSYYEKKGLARTLDSAREKAVVAADLMKVLNA